MQKLEHSKSSLYGINTFYGDTKTQDKVVAVVEFINNNNNLSCEGLFPLLSFIWYSAAFEIISLVGQTFKILCWGIFFVDVSFFLLLLLECCSLLSPPRTDDLSTVWVGGAKHVLFSDFESIRSANISPMNYGWHPRSSALSYWGRPKGMDMTRKIIRLKAVLRRMGPY